MPPITRATLGGLSCLLAGPADAAVTCVMLHGFGAPGDDLAALAGEVAEPAGRVRWLFPAAPLALAGIYGDARAWWLIDLARLEADQARGRPSDRSDEVPPGLAEARAQVEALLDELAAGGAAAPTAPLVLGGFSQGAMLALDVALHRAAAGRAPAGLALLSGTRINAAAWRPRMAALRDVPVAMAHGRGDPLLAFAVAEDLAGELAAAGAAVDWIPFGGGHEIPRAALAGVGRLLARVAAG